MDPPHRTVTTDRALRQRSDRLRFMKRLVHDLNNALSVVSVNVNLLQSGRDPSLAHDHSEAVDEAVVAARRAATLTSQLSRCISEMSDGLPARQQGAAIGSAAPRVTETP